MRRGKMPITGSKQMSKMARTVDDIHDFIEIFEDLLPELKRDLKNKEIKPEDMIAKQQKVLVAKMISLAMKEQDAGKAISAIKDLLDRGIGKPTEKKEVEHRISKLPEEQLDAMLLSKLNSIKEEKKGE